MVVGLKINFFVIFGSNETVSYIDKTIFQHILRLFKRTFLIKGQSMVRQLISINIGCRRHQHSMNLYSLFIADFSKIRCAAKIFFKVYPVKIRLGYSFNCTPFRAEINTINIIYSQSRFCKAFELYPFFTSYYLIREVLFRPFFKTSIKNIFCI